MATELYFAWTTPRPELLTYASPGRVDQPRSCAVRCKDGFFRVTSSQGCRPHSTPSCAPGEYRRAGDHARDATCLPCSGCAGRRRLASCNATADDACAECGALGARQRWVTLGDGGDGGNAGDEGHEGHEGHQECVLACDPGFELNSRTRACELCTTKCAPGLLAPRARDNCTHCEACHPKPAKSDWLTQEDRFDCAWECQPKHALVGDACVRWDNVFEDAPAYAKLQPTCARGTTLVDFKCTPCFDAARTGAVRLADLPQETEEDKTWTWLAGCHWQCRHVLGYTALRSESGKSWLCVQDRRRSLILQGPDDSWVAQAQPQGQPQARGAARTSAQTARTLLSYSMLVVAAVPLLLLKCSLLVHCIRQCKRLEA
jgi:hypothetical protein